MNITHEIEKLAYELYENDGCVQGRDVEHWLRAEQIVHARYAVSFDDKPAKTKKGSAAKPAAKKAGAKTGKTTERR